MENRVTSKEIILRQAEKADVNLIFEWANEKECRRNSFSSEKIEYQDHVQWFKDALESDDLYLYILMAGRKPVGLIRFQRKEKEAVISYSIDRNERGKGYGSMILAAGEAALADERNIKLLVGEVKKENIASQKAFEKCGYQKYIVEDHYQYRKTLNGGNKDDSVL